MAQCPCILSFLSFISKFLLGRNNADVHSTFVLNCCSHCKIYKNIIMIRMIIICTLVNLFLSSLLVILIITSNIVVDLCNM